MGEFGTGSSQDEKWDHIYQVEYVTITSEK
jgi:hypothetical protein